jgi:hypothetical protein
VTSSDSPQPRAADPFTADILSLCRSALRFNHGHPSLAWSTGEQLAVALVLDDHRHLAGMDYHIDEAMRRVRDGWPDGPTDLHPWLDAMRRRLHHEGLLPH